MKDKILIHPKYQQAYIPARVIKAGFKGYCETITNAVTLTIIKPETSLEDVKRGLEITIQDIELRMKQETKEERSVAS